MQFSVMCTSFRVDSIAQTSDEMEENSIKKSKNAAPKNSVTPSRHTSKEQHRNGLKRHERTEHF